MKQKCAKLYDKLISNITKIFELHW